MLMRESLASLVTYKPIFSMTYLALFTLLLMPLAGCSGEGAGGPVISSLSTPTDATAALDSDLASDSEIENFAGEEDPIITMTSTPTGVTANLTWDPPPNVKVTGYQIYYEKHSSENQGSEESIEEEVDWSEGSAQLEDSTSDKASLCSYGESQTVEAPSATIVGLDPGTPYVFAIRAFNESESLCSNEIQAVTPPAQS
ncbi:MAG: fibronectin type III domain-containing protein [Nitrospira sp.]